MSVELLQTSAPLTRQVPLKYLVSALPGGTPSTDDETCWDWSGTGTPWVAIGDMSKRDWVTDTARTVTPVGIASKRLPIGAPGTLLFAMYASVGETAFLSVPATWNQAILGLAAKSDVEIRFIRYCLTAVRPHLASAFRSNTQDNLNAQQVGNLALPVPPISQQRAIADYLDRETAKIDALIEKQTTMIERLRERRARVIEAAIRRGLDSAAALQDSQDAALGSVPAHWRVCRMKHVGRPIIGLTYSPEEVVSEDEGVLVLRAGNIQGGRIDLADTVHVSTSIPVTLRAKEGDILICARNGSAALIGKNAVIPEALSGQTWGAFMVVLRSPLNGYLRWFLNSAVFRAQTGQFATTTINQLTTRTLGNLVVALPPLEEQREIADYLDRETAKIDTLIAKVEQHIELAKERRAALITAAVTGQIDVTTSNQSGDAA